jgi:hypothetical protein
MGAIGTASPYASDLTPSLLTSWPDASQIAGANAAPGAPGVTSGSGRDPATRVDLSNKVKDILARAGSDRDVADRLKAFVEQLRSGGADASNPGTPPSDRSGAGDVNQAFAQLSGDTISTDSQDQPVQPANNFATGLKAGGYTVSAIARASDGSFQIEIVGPDGTGFLDRRFGTSGEFSGFSNLGPGTSAQEYQSGNEEYITFSRSRAAATSVAVSSDAGALSATSSATQTESVTFAVDFSTGEISLAQSQSTTISTTVQIAAPGSTFSTLALANAVTSTHHASGIGSARTPESLDARAKTLSSECGDRRVQRGWPRPDRPALSR